MATEQGTTLGTVLREALDRRDLTQEQLADRLGLKQQAVSKWVTGESKPKPATVMEVAEILLLDPRTLMVLAGHIPSNAEFIAGGVTATDEGSPTGQVAYRDEEGGTHIYGLPAPLAGKLALLSERDLRVVERMVDSMIDDED